MVFLALRHAFEEMQCARVLWKCDDLNEPSKRLARKCGAVFEGVLRKHYLMPSGRHRDRCARACATLSPSPLPLR
jgi:RimJ/RimL family protein N-acetyltransferase